ncbi:MAG TPA: hypothetical protein VLE54_06680 [Thermoanaerobaculia bacterium]|nr:hypothetical protein [Thermoanaerobaculia bacterium]
MARWWSRWPAAIHARARTVKGRSLAIPRRIHASAGRFRKKESVASRIFRNPSTWLAQGNASARAASAAVC